MESSRTDLTTTLLRISRSRFIYGYHMRLPATIARLAELTGELASSTSDGLSERVVKNAVWTTIAAAVSIREFVTYPSAPLRQGDRGCKFTAVGV